MLTRFLSRDIDPRRLARQAVAVALEPLEDRTLLANDLDFGFGPDGSGGAFPIAIPDMPGFEAVDVHDIGDGQFLVAGTMDDDFAVLRCTAGGLLDTTFGADGIATIDVSGNADTAAAMTVDAAGNIYVVGTTATGGAAGDDFGIGRLDADGTNPLGNVVDSFNNRDDRATAVEIDGAGLIVVGSTVFDASSTNWMLAKVNQSDLMLDAGFSGDGRVVDDFPDNLAGPMNSFDEAFDVVVTAGEYIVVGNIGSNFAVDDDANPYDGDAAAVAYDKVTGAAGPVFTIDDAMMDQARGAVAASGDDVLPVGGDLLVVGTRGAAGVEADRELAVTRLDFDPATDTFTTDGGFGAAGFFATNTGDGFATGSDIAVDSQDRIVAVGSRLVGAAGAGMVLRMDADGALDTTFGEMGGQDVTLEDDTAAPTMLTGLTLDGDDNIVVVGEQGGTTGLGRVTATPLGMNRNQTAELIYYRNGTLFVSTDRTTGAVAREVPVGVATPGAEVLVADWNGDQRLDLIAFDRGRWRIDLDRDGDADVEFMFGGNAGDRAFVADYDGDGNVDAIIYDSSGRDSAFTVWKIDTTAQANGVSGMGAADVPLVAFGIPNDRPFVGDYDGNGSVDLGVYRDDGANPDSAFMKFFFDSGRNGGEAEDEVWLGEPGDKPFVGDFNDDGTLDVGVFRYNTAVRPGTPVNQFFFDTNRADNASGMNSVDSEVWVEGAMVGDDGVLLPPGSGLSFGFGDPGAGAGGDSSPKGGATRGVDLAAAVDDALADLV